MSTGTYRIGVDIGGTFTDFILIEPSGAITSWKEESNNEDPLAPIVRGLSTMADSRGQPLEELLRDTRTFVHGSTIATNALIERKGARVGLICTHGFRDVLYLRDGFKPDRFNVQVEHPGSFVERYLTIGVRERIDPAGRVRDPLHGEDVVEAAQRFQAAEVEAVAVALLWSSVNFSHEAQVRSILAEELPGVPVITSAEVLPSIGEWQRTSATALSAFVLPRIRQYLRDLEEALATAKLSRPPLIMQINGGCASVSEVIARPVTTVASGPAAAPAAAKYYTSGADTRDLITIDMGGTSLDISVVQRGRPTMAKAEVEGQPVGVEAVEVLSVGAGGGSIAWLDSGGALRVGPQSAGSRPGPASYGEGGTAPTVTDANVVLGYLEPTAFLGGRKTLHWDLAERAISQSLAEPLGVTTERAAAGVVAMVNENMAAAIRAVSIERGLDPRGFVLVAGGGAGGLHAVALARKVGIGRVVVPAQAGTLCALGMAVTDVRYDFVRPLHMLTSNLEPPALTSLFDSLEEEARSRLGEQGFGDTEMRLERAVDARYPGQVHELTVAIPHRDMYELDDRAEIDKRFHEEHERRFGYALPDQAVECLHWRVTAYGLTGLSADLGSHETAATPGLTSSGTVDDAITGSRDIYVKEEVVSAPVYDARRLAPGMQLSGPAVVQAPDTTVLLDHGDSATIDPLGSLAIVIGVDPPSRRDRPAAAAGSL